MHAAPYVLTPRGRATARARATDDGRVSNRLCAAAARARTSFTKGQTSTRKGTARTQWNYHPSCSPRQSYQRADEYLKRAVCPHSALSAITRPLHFPAVKGRSARVCVLDPAELYARTACMHAYFVWVLYEYVLDLADDCHVRVCLAESGARGRGRVHRSPVHVALASLYGRGGREM